MQCLGTETQALVDGPKERTQFSCTEGGSGRNWSVAGGSMVSLHMPGAEPTLSIISAPSVRDRSRASSSGSSRLFWSVHGCPVMSWNCRDPVDSPWRILQGCSFLMEKAMAPHSSTLAWKIPWMEKPGRLQFMGSLRVGHDWMTSLSLFTFMHWRRKWQPTPVFLPGEYQGQRSLVGCCLWGHTESDTTEAT